MAITRHAALALAATLSLAALPVAAQVAPIPPETPVHPGAHNPYPTLSLNAAARSEVAQDEVRVTMAHELEAADAASVSAKLNEVLKTTLADAKSATDVQAHNGSYQVWPSTDEKGKITGWRGRAEIVLQSKNFDAVSALTGKLGQRMSVTDINFSLSDEARQAEEARLLSQAAQAFQDRAKHAAQAFGFAGYSVRSLNLSGRGVANPPPPMAMRASAMAMKDEMVPVTLQGGRAEVTVSVSGTINLLAK